MPEAIIRYSLRHPALIVLCCGLLMLWGLVSLKNLNLDAIPDTSDVQVVIRINYPGQTPVQVENQVTFPLTSSLMSISEASHVRGFSMLGDAYVYVIFKDGTDYEQARARVLEYVNQVMPKLPEGAEILIGPEASGISWIYQYALVDKSGENELSDLRKIQDWYLKYELQSLPGVAEVAPIGGMVKQYQVVIDPDKQRLLNIPLQRIEQVVRQENQESSGSVIELGEAEYAIHANGYLRDQQDLELLAVGRDPETGTPIFLKDIAQIREGPQMRRGIAELNGEGEVVGGIIIMQAGENPLNVIERVEKKLESLKVGLPEGVSLVTTYDRSQLILSAVQQLTNKLWLEVLAITLVCLLFLWHLPSALVAVISLPLGILMTLMIISHQGVSANIMSLGGIAIAVGTMVDAAIVMIENLHKHLHRWHEQHKKSPTTSQHWDIVRQASLEVGPTLFYSLLIISLSFLPILLLEAEEGKMFAPLAYTKTYAMAAAAALAITLIPVLMGYFIRGNKQSEQANPLMSFLTRCYQPILLWSLKKPKTLLMVCVLLLLTCLYPLKHIQSEFVPELDEGDLLYMPSTLPGISIAKAKQLLQQTDQMIKSVPEVELVFGKAGRAETATDPAPLSMFETTIMLKPKSEWRNGLSLEGLIEELDQKVQIPGLSNAWVQPVKARIDMLSSGVRTPLGIRLSGPDQQVLESLGQEIERGLKVLSETQSVFSDRTSQGRYIEITPNRHTAASLGLSLADIHRTVRLAIGGANVTEMIQGHERYPVNLRYPRYSRDSLEALKNIPVISKDGKQIPLSRVASFEIQQAPAMIKTENARLASWITITTQQQISPSEYIDKANAIIRESVKMPAGYHFSWVGQYQSMQRVSEKLLMIVPLVLLLATIFLFLIFKDVKRVAIILVTLPFSLVGGLWYLWLLDFQFSVATSVGFLALLGIAVEFSVVMLLYLQQMMMKADIQNAQTIHQAVVEGALSRLRPKIMTLSVVIFSLLMVMLGQGSGLDVMQRIAAPILGGMITAPLLSLLIIPCAYYQLCLLSEENVQCH